MNSLYTDEFDGKTVRNVHPAPGNISPTKPATINMDAGISLDGQTLYISRVVIFPGAAAPKKAELMVAQWTNGAFSIDADSERIMKNVNSAALQYAPCISADGRELYFTRASQARPGADAAGASVRIVVATRSSLSQPFGQARALTALTGYVEALSISPDGKEMFFHKKVGAAFLIYRAERKLQRF